MSSLLERNSKKIPMKFNKICYPISFVNIIGTEFEEPQLKGMALWRSHRCIDKAYINLELMSIDTEYGSPFKGHIYYNTRFTFFSYSNFKKKCQRSHFYSFVSHKFMNSERRRGIKYKYT